MAVAVARLYSDADEAEARLHVRTRETLEAIRAGLPATAAAVQERFDLTPEAAKKRIKSLKDKGLLPGGKAVLHRVEPIDGVEEYISMARDEIDGLRAEADRREALLAAYVAAARAFYDALPADEEEDPGEGE
jgi:DNA-binding Lrp family transcriptional regulator